MEKFVPVRKRQAGPVLVGMDFYESHRREERHNEKTGQKERGLLCSPPPEQRVPKED